MLKPILLLALLLPFLPAQAPAPAETPAARDARLAWWREARFGMFIHWGLYAIPAGVWRGREVPGIGEWIQFHGKIPVADYEPLAQEFAPAGFDARAWARLARRAGMRYIVITSKHHDGFCLFDSKLTGWDVMDATPFKRDILKELAEATREEGLRICWYHSILDWHHPDYLPRGPGSPRPWDTRPAAGADYGRYLDYMQGQLREILTNYGPIGVLWFDGGWEHKAAEHRADEVVALIRSLQPGIIINNRLGIPQDFDTPEQYIPATGLPGRDWETCMTMNDTWGFKAADQRWKSEETLIRNLVDTASKGGNFLLNVGPTAAGLIPEASVTRLEAMGRWLAVNGEAIHGTAASPFRRLPWGRCTARPGRLYLHVFAWPAGGRLAVPGLRSPIARAWLLADAERRPLTLEKAGDDPVVRLPEAAPDPVATVVVLEVAGSPLVDDALRQEPGGALLLAARDAMVHGRHIRYESDGGKDNIGFWTDRRDWVEWEVEVRRPGAFRMEIDYACPEESAGSTFRVSGGEAVLTGKVEATGSWTEFRTFPLGRIEIPKAGTWRFAVRVEAMPRGAVMNLKALRGSPLET